jgi:hypothetical protein
MTVKAWSRTIGIVGVSVVVSLAVSGPAAAQPPPGHGQQKQEDRKEAKREQQGQKKEAKEQGKQARQNAQQEQQLARQLQQAQQRQEQEQATQAQRRLQQERVNVAEQQRRAASQDQQNVMRQQEQRVAQYRDHLNEQQRVAPPQVAQLRQQNRLAQFNVQQEYVSRLRTQQARVQASGRDGYYGYASAYQPPTYRYSRGGQAYQTNQRGADLLRQAVSYGYQEGVRAGLADRQDRWSAAVGDSYAYRDANYGYAGYDVDREDYNAYFREGFSRGYEDGYQSRYRYGSYGHGRVTILGAVLATILSFEIVR